MAPGRVVPDVWLDPSCPYTWLTFQWLLEVRTVRPLDVRWHVMSLAVLNEHLDVDPEGDWDGYLWVPVRVCAAVRQRHGTHGLEAFCTALGVRVHERGEWGPDGIRAALADAGLPETHADAGHSTRYDEAVRASHAEGTGLVGDGVGTPVIALPGADGHRIAFFGPVVSAVPRAERAARLWDALAGLSGLPEFAELKRPRALEV